MKRNNIESRIQIAAMVEIEKLFNYRWKEFLIPLENSKKEIVMSSPVYAVPNGSNRNVVTATILKKEGVKSGVSDLILPLANLHYNSLWIEVKKPKGRQSKNQLQWEIYCNKFGIKYVICYSTQEIIDTVISYMGDV
jgi:hypothetical protein